MRKSISKGSAGETQIGATQNIPPKLREPWLLVTSREQLLLAVFQSQRRDCVGPKLATGLWRKATSLVSPTPSRGTVLVSFLLLW